MKVQVVDQPQGIEPLQRWIRSRSKLARQFERPHDPLAELPMTVASEELTGHVVLAGYGRVGRRIGETLAEKGVRFVVAEQNREVVEELRQRGMHAVSGDASELNTALPEKFFTFQDELRERSRALAAAVDTLAQEYLRAERISIPPCP